MPRFYKKIVLSFLVAVLLFATAIPLTAHAQDQPPREWYDQSFQQWYSKVYDTKNSNEIFGERYTAAQVQWVIYSFFSFVIRGAANGNDVALKCLFTSNAAECLKGTYSSTKLLTFQDNQKGLLATVFEERSFSGITYLKNTIRRFHLIPEAKAQAGPGFGFSALGPIQPLWGLFRNIAYSLMVIVILIMAFMIMFRVKISPQVVITVQSALPKIAIGLVLITFSYAIAGFIIDLMYVVIGLISLVFSSAGASTGVFNLLTRGPENLGVLGLIITYFFLLFLAATILTSNVNLLAGIFGIVLIVVVLIATIFIAIRIIWVLIKAFTSIFLMTIFAPFQILLGLLIPNMGFTSWIRSFIANIAVFPITGLLFLLSYLFLFAIIQKYDTSLSNAMIPDAGKAVLGWPPLLNSNSQFSDFVFIAASFVIFSIIPSSVNLIKSMIEGKPLAFGTAISGPLGIAAGVTAFPATATYGVVSQGVQKGVAEDIASYVSKLNILGRQKAGTVQKA